MILLATYWYYTNAHELYTTYCLPPYLDDIEAPYYKPISEQKHSPPRTNPPTTRSF